MTPKSEKRYSGTGWCSSLPGEIRFYFLSAGRWKCETGNAETTK